MIQKAKIDTQSSEIMKMIRALDSSSTRIAMPAFHASEEKCSEAIQNAYAALSRYYFDKADKLRAELEAEAQ